MKLWESESSASLAITVKDSLPLQSDVALKLIAEPSKLAVILSPPITSNVKLSPSTSLAEIVISVLPSSSNSTSDMPASSGTSLTGKISIFTDWVSLNSPSETVTSKDTEPKKSWTPVIDKILPSIDVFIFTSENTL